MTDVQEPELSEKRCHKADLEAQRDCLSLETKRETKGKAGLDGNICRCIDISDLRAP